jgi:glycosyltransferase involved in cell wall biosynthesis
MKGLTMRDVVSVILPYYNRVDTLRRAAESVLEQTHRPLVLYLVDDGSSDGSSDLARSLRDERIVHISHEVNRGVSEARNSGLDRAETDLVAFMDSDDVWLQKKLATQLAFLREAQAAQPLVAVVGCGWQYLDAAEPASTFRPGPFRRDDFLQGHLAGTGTPLLLVDRAVAADARFDPEFPAFEEGDYVLKCLRRGAELAITPESLVLVRRGRGDHVANQRSAAEGYSRLLEVYERDLARHPEARGWFAFRACRHYLALGELREACRLVPAAMCSDRFRRSVHIGAGAIGRRHGLSVAQRLLPVRHPRSRI